MTANLLKQTVVELTRGGCRVERLNHDPVVVTFRRPDGEQLQLAASTHEFRLGSMLGGQIVRFGTLGEALRAACAS